MNKAGSLEKQIDVLHPAMLSEVDRLVKSLKKQVRKPGKRVSLLSEPAECVLDDNLPPILPNSIICMVLPENEADALSGYQLPDCTDTEEGYFSFGSVGQNSG